MDKLIRQTKELLDLGIYDQHQLFDLIMPFNRHKHYNTIRRAIHIAKAGIYK